MAEKDLQIEENRFNRHWEQFYAYLESDLDSAFYCAEKVKKLAKDSNNKRWQAKSSEGLAYVFFSKGHFGEAVYQYLEASKIYEELEDLYKLADVYNNLGGQYSRIKDHRTALSYFKQAKDIYDYEGQGSDRAMINRNLALCYKELRLYAEAEDHLNTSTLAALKTKDYYTVAEAYNTWGGMYSEQGKYEEARKLFLLSAQYADSLKNGIRLKSIAYNNICDTYLREENSQQTRDWIKKTLALKRQLNDPSFNQYTYNILGQLLIKEEKYFEAIEALEAGLQHINPTSVDNSVGEGLFLITEALTKASNKSSSLDDQYLIQKFTTYSHGLAIHSQSLSGTKEGLEIISQQREVQAAAERYAFNEQLEASQSTNTQMRYAFLIPITLLLIALASVYLAVKKNRHYKKLYSNIEQVLNNSKALRHLK